MKQKEIDSSIEEKMGYKFVYMTRLFFKIKHKKIESYVISRIWHQLNDDRVRFVVQQYIRRKDGKYALADLYLPQLNMIVEVNESYHTAVEQKLLDGIRENEITQELNADVENVDCSVPMELIHKRISEVVEKIKVSIRQQGDKFQPWEGDEVFTVNYLRKKGYLKAYEDSVCTIDDAAAVIGTTVKHRGFQRVGISFIPGKNDEMGWWPNVDNKNWRNELSEDGHTILEYSNEIKTSKLLDEWTKKSYKRITFLKYKDSLGFNFYHFIGVFEINIEKSKKEKKCVWELVSDTYKL